MADSKIAIHGAIAANVAIAVTKFVVAGITGIDLSALWAQATAPQRWAAPFERGGGHDAACCLSCRPVAEKRLILFARKKCAATDQCPDDRLGMAGRPACWFRTVRWLPHHAALRSTPPRCRTYALPSDSGKRCGDSVRAVPYRQHGLDRLTWHDEPWQLTPPGRICCVDCSGRRGVPFHWFAA